MDTEKRYAKNLLFNVVGYRAALASNLRCLEDVAGILCGGEAYTPVFSGLEEKTFVLARQIVLDSIDEVIEKLAEKAGIPYEDVPHSELMLWGKGEVPTNGVVVVGENAIRQARLVLQTFIDEGNCEGRGLSWQQQVRRANEALALLKAPNKQEGQNG